MTDIDGFDLIAPKAYGEPRRLDSLHFVTTSHRTTTGTARSRSTRTARAAS